MHKIKKNTIYCRWLYCIFFFFIIFNINILFAAPAALNTLNVYRDASFSDSTITYVTVNDRIHLRADTIFPVWTGVPDYFYCEITHTSDLTDTIYIKMVQDSSDTKIYKATDILIDNQGKSNGQLKTLGVLINSGETIYFSYNNIVFDSIVVAVSQPPSIINNINFYSDAGFTQIIANDSGLPFESTVYVQVNANDASEWTIDTFPIIVSGKYDSFNMILTETGKNTGKFTGNLKLTTSTSSTYNYIKVLLPGDTVTIRENVSNKIAVISAQNAQEATDFYGIKFTVAASGAVVKTDSLVLQNNLFIRLQANDPNPNVLDISRVIVKNATTGDSFIVVLNESTNGVYLGSAYISSYTNATSGYLGASAGDLIVISSLTNNVADTLGIAIPAQPTVLNNIRFMNSNYSEILTGNIPPLSVMYIEANGADGNIQTIDTMICYVTSNRDASGIQVVLTETAINTGKYRGMVKLHNFSDTILAYITAFANGDTVGVSATINSVTKSDTKLIQTSISPTIVSYIQFKTSDYSAELLGEILPSDNVYIEAVAVDLNPNAVDTLAVRFISGYDTIAFDLFETTKNSGIFRNSAILFNHTNQTIRQLKTEFGDAVRIEVSDSITVFDTVAVTVPTQPTVINSLRFMNTNYSTELGDSTAAYVRLNIEMTAADRNPYFADTKQIICYGISGGVTENIPVILTETAKNSGIFRGHIELNSFSYSPLNYIKAYLNGDAVSIYAEDKFDTITVHLTAAPSVIVSVNAKESADYLINKSGLYTYNDYVYVEVIAVDANPYTIDTIPMYAYTTISDSINFTLLETAQNSNRYRGRFRLTTISNNTLDELGVNFGDIITIKIAHTTDSIQITMAAPAPPTMVNNINFYRDAGFTQVIANDSGLSFESIVYIQANGADASALTIDTFAITVSGKYDSFNMILTETGRNTGKYTGSLKLTTVTNAQYNYIKVLLPGDTVTIIENLSNKTAVISAQNIQEATVFNDIKFTVNAGGSSIKSDSLVLQSNLFIRLQANDPNPNVLDMARVIVKNSTTGDSFVVVLNEYTSGIYLGSAYITTYTNATLGYLGAKAGDLIVISSLTNNVADTLGVAIPAQPAVLNNISFMNSNYSEILTGNIPSLSVMYIEANGADGNIQTIDTMICYVTSNRDASGIQVVLTETAVNTGKYRGMVKLHNFSDTILMYITAFANGDTVGVSATINSVTKSDTKLIQSSVSPIFVSYIQFKTSDYSAEMLGEILPSDNVYIEAVAVDLNPNAIDTLAVRLISGYDTIVFDLFETTKNSGIFRNSAILSNHTNQTARQLKTAFGDAVKIEVSDSVTVFDTVAVTVPASPTVINSLRFMNDTFAIELGDSTAAYVRLNIEMTAADRNPYFADTKQIICYGISGGVTENIPVILTETAKNSGIFRGYVELNNFSFATLNYIKAYLNGDIISIYAEDKFDTINVFLTTSPSTIISINVKDDNSFMINRQTLYAIGDIVYVEVVAVDANPLTIDNIPMQAYVNISDIVNFTLVETSINSNRYRGSFKLSAISNDTIDELGVRYGDTIVIKSANTSDSITVNLTIPVSPIVFNELLFTTSNFMDPWPFYNQVDFGYIAYVRMTATDLNPLTADTFGVILYVIADNGSDTADYIFNLTLVETGKHTGVYTANVLLDNVKSIAQNRMKIKHGTYIVLAPGDTPAASITDIDNEILANEVARIQTATPRSPTTFISIKLKTDESFNTEKFSPIMWNKFLYVEVEADKLTSSDLVQDTIAIRIISETERNSNLVSETTAYYLLTETGKHTGIYRSEPRQIEVVDFTEVGQQLYTTRLEVTSGDWVYLTVLNPSDLQPSSTTFQREVAYPVSPNRVKNIRIFRNSNYTETSRINNGLISFEPDYRYMYFEVEAYDLEGTVTDTYPYANDELRDTVELVLNSTKGDTIRITLLETGNSTNIYRNWLQNPYLVQEQAIQNIELSANRNDTITIFADVIDTGYRAVTVLKVEEFKSPTEIRSIRFFTNSSYNVELAGLNYLMEDNIYIQAVGRYSANILIDTIPVTLFRNYNNGASQDSITIILTETAVGSEIYRILGNEPIPRIYYYTDDNSNFMYAVAGDTITVMSTTTADSSFDVTKMGRPQSPTSFFNLNVFTNDLYSAAVADSGLVADNARLYIEARGDVGNNVVRDTTPYKIRNLRSNEFIIITLVETGGNDGRYRGTFRLTPATNDTLDELGVNLGDYLEISCADAVTVTMPNYPKIIKVVESQLPVRLNNIYFKDLAFNQNINQIGGKTSITAALNIEVNGQDANDLLAEYIDVYLYSVDYKVAPVILSDTTGYSIANARGYLKLRLHETGLHTGKYRGTAYIRDYNDTNQRFLRAFEGDTLYAFASLMSDSVTFDTESFKSDTISVATNQVLEYITFLNFRQSNYQSDWGDYATFGDNLYVMLFGDVGSPVLADDVDVIVYKILAGDTVASDSLTLTLKETGLTTGEFRARLNLGMSPTDVKQPLATPPIMSVNNGDTLVIIWKDNDQTYSSAPIGAPKSGSVIDSIVVTAGLIPISPPADALLSLRITDQNYINAVDTITTEILPTDKVYIEMIALDQNNFTVDTARVIIQNMNTGEMIYKDLIESAKSSGEFQGFITLTTLSTNQSQFLLNAGYNHTIRVFAAVAPETHNWQVHTTYNKRPKVVSSIKYTNSDFTQFLGDKTLANQILHIEANGLDANPLIADTFIVYVSSNRDTAGIRITLKETAVNSGRYRGWVKLNNFTNEELQYILADAFGDTIVVSEIIGFRQELIPNINNFTGLPGRRGWVGFGNNWLFAADSYTVYDTENLNMYSLINIENQIIPPQNIVAVRVKQTPTYLTDRTESVGLGDILYIELSAMDLNPLGPDQSDVIVISTSLNNWQDEVNNRIEVRLNETGNNTSKFRGTVLIATRTNDTIDELKINFGDTIYVISKTDTNVFITLQAAVLQNPLTMNYLEFTTSNYQTPYPKGNQVQYGDTLYIRFTGNDASPYTVDKVRVLVTSSAGHKTDTGSGENQLIVTLTETGKHTGIYTGSFTIAGTKNQMEENPWLKSPLGDFIYLEPYDTSYWGAAGVGKAYNQIIADSVQTATAKTPDYIFSISLKKDATYNQTKMSPVLWGDGVTPKFIYIEAQADKITSSNLLADTVKVSIKASNDTGNQDLILYETGIHTGIFRGSIEVRNINFITTKLANALEVLPGDTIEIRAVDPPINPQFAPVVYQTRAAIEVQPTRLKNIRVYRTNQFSGASIDEVSYEESFKYMYIEAEAWDIEGGVNDTAPFINDELRDTFTMVIKNTVNGDSVRIELIETAANSNIFRTVNNIPYITTEDTPPQNALKAQNRGDTIIIYPDLNVNYLPSYYVQHAASVNFDTKYIKVAEYRAPDVKAVNLYTNAGYTTLLSGKNLLIEDFLYPQVVGREFSSNPILRDTVQIQVFTSSNPDTPIIVTLRETAVGSEIYRVDVNEPLPRLWYWTQPNQNFIEAKSGDKITAKYGVWEDFTYLAQYQSPTRIKTLFVYRDSEYSVNYQGKAVPRETALFIEARSDDFGNNILNDTTIVTLNANRSIDTVSVILTEISPMSGVYRGVAYLGIQSSSTKNTLGVNYGDTVYIGSAIMEDTTRQEITLTVVSNENPTTINSVKFMNSTYTDLLFNTTNSRVLQNERIYLELNGLDANPYLIDYTTNNFVYVYTIPLLSFNAFTSTQLDSPDFYNSSAFISKINGGISVNLLETEKNSGKYRNWLQLSNVSDTYQQLLKHSQGDIILVRVIGPNNNLIYKDTALVAIVEEPAYLSFLNFKINFSGAPSELQNRDMYVDFGETLYIQAFGDIGSQLLPDTTLVYLIRTRSSGATDSVPVILYETNKTTGFYQGVAKLTPNNFQPTVRDAAPPILNVDRGDTIVVKWQKNLNISDTLYVIQPQPKPPKLIQVINFYRNAQYSDFITDRFDVDGNIYLEIIEKDTTNVNAMSSVSDIDTLIIQVSNGRDTIHIHCVETGRNTKVYRGSMKLGTATNETLKILESEYGMDVIFTPYVSAGYSYFIDIPSISSASRWRKILDYGLPLNVTSLKFMNSTYTTAQPAHFSPSQGDRVYFEMNGEDGNPLLADKFSIVSVEVYMPNGQLRSDTFLIETQETGKNMGIYRGWVDIDRFTFPLLQKIRAEAGDTLVLRESISGREAKTVIALPSEPAQIFDLVYISAREIDYQILKIQATAADVNPNIADYITVNIGTVGANNYYNPDSIYVRLYQPITGIASFVYEGQIQFVGDTHDFYTSSIPKFFVARGDTIFVRWLPRAYSPLAAREFEDRILMTVPRPPVECSNIKINISATGNIVDSVNNWREDRFLVDLRVGNIMQFSAFEKGPYASNLITVDTFGILLVNNDYLTDRPGYRNAAKYASAIDEDSYILIQFTETGDSTHFYKSGIIEISDEFIYYYTTIENYHSKRWADRLFIRPGDNLTLKTIPGLTQFPNSEVFFRDFASFFILDQTISGGFNYYPNPVKNDNSVYGSNYLTFDNVKEGAAFKIVTIDGRLVYENKSVPKDSPDGVKNRFYWNLTNRDGKKVASGIYIFVTTDNEGAQRTGKIAVIR